MTKDYLAHLKDFYRQNKRLPSYSEMVKLFGFASKKSVFDLVQKWIEDGMLQKINDKLSPTNKFFSLPLLGIIKAGYPILAEENKQYLSLDEYLIDDPNSSFLLRVSGDSLMDEGIYDGDIVIIHRTKEANAGDIVLAEIDKEFTLKILKKDTKRKINYLVAANPNYPPFYPKYELKIHGIVQGVVRKLYN
jgi:repressor LexA